MRRLRNEVRLVTFPDGRRAVVVDPVIPDDAPPDVREGLARRKLANAGRPCPCGAAAGVPVSNRAQRRAQARSGAAGLPRAEVLHEADCPASDTYLAPRLRAWATPATEERDPFGGAS